MDGLVAVSWWNVVVEVEALYKTTRGVCGLRAGDVGQL
jgi:hypothetical protein